MGSVSAEDINLTEAIILNTVDNQLRVMASPGTSQECSALVMYAVDDVFSELSERQFVRIEALKAKWNAIDLFNTVSFVQGEEYFAHDSVQSRAKASACYDAHLHSFRVKSDEFSWAGTSKFSGDRFILRMSYNVDQYSFMIGHKVVHAVRNLQRRWIFSHSCPIFYHWTSTRFGVRLIRDEMLRETGPLSLIGYFHHCLGVWY
mmetsp:Transcript_7021/g.21375  ORF Transcript_7021/g.21375 Transcript_7021/m.21375 type:complete len:204 (-) Transcript_7021:320-931(-)